MATSAIDKEERAGRTLACLHLREILPTDQVSHCGRNWEQQGVGRAPAPLDSPRELRLRPPMATIDRNDLTERLVTPEHTVQGLDFLHCVLPQRLASVFLHERAKPFAQRPRLRRHSVEFSRDGALLKACTHGGRYQAGGAEPRQQILDELVVCGRFA